MDKIFETREMPDLYTRATISTIDVEKREFDVVFATNSAVPMYNMDRGAHLEILDMKPESVRLTRLNSGAPLLDNHTSYEGTRGVLGVVIKDSALVDGGKATARIRMSARDEVAGIWRDIQDGILSTISVGYQVHRAVIEDAEKKLYRAIDWEPFEISLAPIPADINATIRAKTPMHSVEIEITTSTYEADRDLIELTQAKYKYKQ